MTDKLVVKEYCRTIIYNSKIYIKMPNKEFFDYIDSNGIPALIPKKELNNDVIRSKVVQNLIVKQRQKIVKRYFDLYKQLAKENNWMPLFFHGTDIRYFALSSKDRSEFHNLCERLIDYLKPYIIAYVMKRVPVIKQFKVFFDVEKTAKQEYVEQVYNALSKFIYHPDVCMAVARLFFRHKKSSETEGIFLTSSMLSALQYTNYGNSCGFFGIIGINAMVLWYFAKTENIDLPPANADVKKAIEFVEKQACYKSEPLVLVITKIPREMLLNQYTSEPVSDKDIKEFWKQIGNVKLASYIDLSRYFRLSPNDLCAYDECAQKLKDMRNYRKGMNSIIENFNRF